MNFFQMAASVADMAADNPNGNKTLLTNECSRLFINGRSAVINAIMFSNHVWTPGGTLKGPIK